MAVFTPLSTAQAAAFIKRYDVGSLVELADVDSGTENSTFFVTTDRHRLVLTLFEQGETRELEFFVAMLAFLARHALPVPGPLVDRQGQVLHSLANRPALLFPRLPGRSPDTPSLRQCEEIGHFMGRMHAVSHAFDGQHPNQRDHRWIAPQIKRVLPFLSGEDQTLLEQCGLALCHRFEHAPALPTGAIHGDLFRDNALFEGDRLGGVIDFYNGCIGHFAYDLAVLVNDWCCQANGTVDDARYGTLLTAYAQHRTFTKAERAYWHDLLKLTALRYWLSRLLVIHVDPPALQLTPKPPQQFLSILKAHLTSPVSELP